MEAVLAPLPELPAIGGEEISAPVFREFDRRRPWVGGGFGGEGRLKRPTGGGRLALATGAGTELALARTAGEVGGRLDFGELSHRT